MSAELISAVSSYRATELAESTYLRARDEWDSRIGATVIQARNWRLACVLSMGLSFILIASLFHQSSLNKVVPMVIALDRISGEPKIIGKVTEIGYEPQIAEIKYFLSQFVSRVRSVPNDPVLIKQNWLEAYQFMRPKAAQILNDLTNSDAASPLKNIGQNTIVVQPISITKINNESPSYQVRWSETKYSQNGGKAEKYIMNGVFTLELDTPTSEKALAVNPLGIFITGFEWSRELNTEGK